ncbi:hypothetical protein Angca_006280, partial [Angiostrongylus cantonensis]
SCRENEICTGGSICTHPIALCLCPGELEERDGECVLPPTATMQITKAGIGSPCSDLVECDHGSSCVMGHCACVAPLIQHNDVCVLMQEHKEVGPGEPCDNGNICACGSVCDSTIPVCVCPPNTDLNNGSCVDMMTISRSDANEKCGLLNDYPQCSNGFLCINKLCLCPDTYSINNGICSNNQPDQELTLCEEACQPPRSCINNRCECVNISCLPLKTSRSRHRGRRHIVEKSMVCWPGAAQCSAGNGVCVDNVCHCINGFVERDGACAPEIVPLNEKCDPNHISPRCADNAVCTNNICTCAIPGGCTGEQFVMGPRFSDGRCQTDRQCPDGRCIAGRCQCNDGFTLQVITQLFLHQCTVGDRCSGGSTCRGHVCQCVDGSFEYHDRCRQSPGGRCTYGQTCDGGSICEFGLCRCPVGNFIDAGRCVVGTSVPGKSCQHGQKCVHGSVCRFGMCMCIAKYTASKGRCVRRENILYQTTTSVTPSIRIGAVKSPGIKCNDKDLCSGGSQCREGFCLCKDSEVIINEMCVGSHEQANEIIEKLLIAAPGQPCDTRTNCTGGSKCINRSCTCENGVIDDTGTCNEGNKVHSTSASAPKKSNDSLQPGTICALTIECPYRTECLRSVCRCKKGETIVDNTCRKAIHQVLPGGKCDPRKGYDCVGESQCFYGICTCTRHLINNGKECVTMAEMVMVKPGIKCGVEQICSGGARCIDGVCKCPRGEVSDVNNKCVRKSQVTKVFLPRSPASMCDEATCRLPNCFCSRTGRRPPGGLSPSDIPQFVVLTFDDAVNGRTFPDYLELFEKVKYRNPNGCPIKATFFVSHEWTNYDAVQWLFQQGMEVASNSISHVSLEGASTNRWLNEMEGQRRIMARFANVNEEDIIGMRAPQLALGGDAQFEMMIQASFHYDNSMSVDPGTNTEPFWPQTMDHSVPWDCYDAQCPTRSFPGLWEMPMNQFYGSYLPEIDSFRRSTKYAFKTRLFQTNMLFSNFERSYLTNRAPYVLSLNADLLQLNGKNTGMEALQRFLEEVLYKKDVYVVTMRQLLHWMRNPVTLTRVSQADSLKCEQSASSHYPSISKTPCIKSNKCMYQTPGLPSQEHEFLTCSSCPNQYPWFDNTLGN